MGAIRYAFLLFILCCITACGGGSGGGGITTIQQDDALNSAHSATLKLATSGSPSSNLAGIAITVILPDGVTPILNSDGTVAPSVVTISGVAVPGAVLAPIYKPASGTTNGTLRFVLANSVPTGFSVGEFATLTLTVAPGFNPALSDFTLSDFTPIDIGGNTATVLIPSVASLEVR